MKITKVARLLKKLEHVRIESLTATGTSMGNADIVAKIGNAEAILGYRNDEYMHGFPAYVSVNGGEDQAVELSAPPDGETFGGPIMSVPRGATVRVTLKINPEKVEFDQNPVSETAIVG